VKNFIDPWFLQFWKLTFWFRETSEEIFAWGWSSGVYVIFEAGWAIPWLEWADGTGVVSIVHRLWDGWIIVFSAVAAPQLLTSATSWTTFAAGSTICQSAHATFCSAPWDRCCSVLDLDRFVHRHVTKSKAISGLVRHSSALRCSFATATRF